MHHGDRDFLGLEALSLTGELTWIDAPEADVAGAALSPDGTTLAWGVNEDGYTRLRWAPVGGDDRPQPAGARRPAELVLHPGVGHEIDRAGLAAPTDLIASWFVHHLG